MAQSQVFLWRIIIVIMVVDEDKIKESVSSKVKW